MAAQSINDRGTLDNSVIIQIEPGFEARLMREVLNNPDDPNSGLRNAYRFLKELTKIEPNEFHTGDRNCNVCQETYGTDGHDKKVVQLPQCGHRFGFDCIFDWLSPMNKPNRNTCPICRAVLFEIDRLDEDVTEVDYDRSAFIPELWALLDLETFEAYIGALDFIEPLMRGTANIPEGLTYSRQMLPLFCELPQTAASDGNPRSEAMKRDAAAKLAVLMGQLYAKFGAQMESMQMEVPWGLEGPSVQDLLSQDQLVLDSILVGLYRYIEFEDTRAPPARRHSQ